MRVPNTTISSSSLIFLVIFKLKPQIIIIPLKHRRKPIDRLPPVVVVIVNNYHRGISVLYTRTRKQNKHQQDKASRLLIPQKEATFTAYKKFHN